jgi:hypothetical protein
MIHECASIFLLEMTKVDPNSFFSHEENLILIKTIFTFWWDEEQKRRFNWHIYAEVVTFVAGSPEARGLPGYPEVF